MMNSADAREVVPAVLEWRDGSPYSTEFGDIYYTRGGGRSEVEHVFLAGNDLPVRWSGGDFSIAETGFGTGLNFLVAAERWLARVPAPAVLYYLSVEKHPLSRDDLARVLALRGDDSAIATELLAHYPPPVAGGHRLTLAGGRIQLSLWFGDAAQQLAAVRAAALPGFETEDCRGIDAWFLDGFAPARNPQMWSEDLFAQVAALSRMDTTFATFTAAGAVRRGLQAVGFRVRRVPGYGTKREMLRGAFVGRDEPESAFPTPDGESQRRRRRGETPWDLGAGYQGRSDRGIAVVGAGIAGCTTAWALAERGLRVCVFDGGGIATGASGNPQGIVFPRLAAVDSPFARINLAALLHARRFYQSHWAAGVGQNLGVLILPRHAGEARQLKNLASHFPDGVARYLSGPDVAETAGVPLDASAGLLLPGLGWLPPAELCRRLLDHPDIQFVRQHVEQLVPQGDGWWLMDDAGGKLGRFAQIVLATGAAPGIIAATAMLPLRVMGGQLTGCPATPASQRLRVPVCGQGYLAPACNGFHSLGATYRPDSRALTIDPLEHQANLRGIENTDAALAAALGNPPDAMLTGRVGLRAVTPDYLPVVGPVPEAEHFLETFAPLRRDARAALPRRGHYWSGLYVNSGYGSRGLSYAPLCAALLADLMGGHPRALARDLVRALSPARFLIRDLQRRRR